MERISGSVAARRLYRAAKSPAEGCEVVGKLEVASNSLLQLFRLNIRAAEIGLAVQCDRVAHHVNLDLGRLIGGQVQVHAGVGHDLHVESPGWGDAG